MSTRQKKHNKTTHCNNNNKQPTTTITASIVSTPETATQCVSIQLQQSKAPLPATTIQGNKTKQCVNRSIINNSDNKSNINDANQQ